MTEEKTKLVDKIRKLMALANSPNENEATAAMEKAQALLIEHNLSMSDVTTESGGKVKRHLVMDGEVVTVADAWMRSVAVAIAKLYFCEYFFTTRVRGNTRNDRHTFIGDPQNIAVAKEMFGYLVKTIRRLATEGAKQVPQKEFHKYRKSFYWACTGRIGQRCANRIAAMRRGEVKASDGSRNLPVVASLYDSIMADAKALVQAQVGDIKPSNTKATYSSSLGLRDGLKAGDQISLDNQIGSRVTNAPRLT